MNNKKGTGDSTERLNIQEKALSNLADAVKKHDVESREEIKDLQAEFKALKLFLARTMPEFKQQFPEIQRKLK